MKTFIIISKKIRKAIKERRFKIMSFKDAEEFFKPNKKEGGRV